MYTENREINIVIKLSSEETNKPEKQYPVKYASQVQMFMAKGICGWSQRHKPDEEKITFLEFEKRKLIYYNYD